ncbi:MAG TPA: GNAT family N-acetyltransferase, partial [Solirubrobacteraceae bacterium]|nr:GNAT family N-acetyltransferase [Solirubrobacteraceae bacterium]
VHYTLPQTGQRVAFRYIRPDDKERLAAALARLSPESQRRRFLTAKPRLSASELRYLTEIDGIDHVAVLAVLADDPDAIVGVGRFVRLRDLPDTAEVAIVVGDAFQGQGLGRELGRRLADEARERSVRRFTATLLNDNVAAHRLFHSISDRLEGRNEGGTRVVTAQIAAA